MNVVLASSAARPLVGNVVSTRPRTVGAASTRPSGGVARVAALRSATLNLARTADDLRAASAMTAAARRFRAAANVERPIVARTSHR